MLFLLPFFFFLTWFILVMWSFFCTKLVKILSAWFTTEPCDTQFGDICRKWWLQFKETRPWQFNSLFIQQTAWHLLLLLVKCPNTSCWGICSSQSEMLAVLDHAGLNSSSSWGWDQDCKQISPSSPLPNSGDIPQITPEQAQPSWTIYSSSGPKNG